MAAAPVLPLRIGGVGVSGTSVRNVLSPYDARVVARVEVAGPGDLEAALEAATVAAPIMAGMAAHRRGAALARAAELLRERADLFAATIRDEGGKPIRYAKGEVERAIRTFEACAGEAVRLHGEAPALDTAPQGERRTAIVRRRPLGVVAAITPFNFPLNLCVHKVGPALAAGNAVVLKPSERCPATGLLLGALLDECGFPPGAVNVVVGSDPSLGEALVLDPRPAAISFTGSSAVGWGLRAKAGRKHVVLELGGNAAVVIDRSADLDDAATRLAEAAFAHAGQVCIKAQRVFVHAEVAGSFRERLLDRIRGNVRFGDPKDPLTVVGPLISAEAAARVEGWVAVAAERGARVTRFGAREGNVVPPIVVEGAPLDADVHRKEIFGPVLTLDPVVSFEEGLTRADDTVYGLQASVFTADLDAALRAEERLTVGAVIVNDVPTFRVDTMPYGGERESGLGREGVRDAVHAFTTPRMLVIRRR